MNSDKLTRFAEVLKEQQLEGLRARGLDCDANVFECETRIRPGTKYTKVDIGSCGRYMVTDTGEIFGVKAYGVIHRGHAYGTLDTIDQWDWSGYRAVPKVQPQEAAQ